MDWTDPKYARLVEAMRRAQDHYGKQPDGRTVRGFIIHPEKKG
ncbi:hypothetical protein [Streptomyces atacamensis]